MKEHSIKAQDQYYIQATTGIADNRIVSLKEGDVFSVSDKFGDIKHFENIPYGIYSEGTRFISRLEMLINDQSPFLLSSGLNEENEMHTVDLTNPDIRISNGKIIEKGNIQLQRKKFLWQNVYYDAIKLCNFAIEPVTFKISFVFDADFKDIFEVRGMERKLKGEQLNTELSQTSITFRYCGADNICRNARIELSPPPDNLTLEKVDYHFTLYPRQCENIFISIAFEAGEKKTNILPTDEAYLRMISRMTNIKNSGPKIRTSNNQFNQWITRSFSDLFTLTTEIKTGPYPYAGIPWYSTPFGRDAIITSLETLWIFPARAKYVLKFLAETQAKTHDDSQDAEPGKIFHERRSGEMANTGEIPFKLYYGSIDATPLFIVLASKYHERTGDTDFIREIWPSIELALTWMDKYGDIDGDGFLEYKRKKESGLSNQGWKDSWDSIFDEEGILAEKPIALCEVQGYAYSAKLGAAKIYKLFGNIQRSNELNSQAEDLKKKFASAFWSEEKNIYAIALNAQKKQCHVRSSNAGHSLFTGIAQPEHASKMIKTLLSSNMFSGWGIRTIAKNEIRYNPMSYHNGSVWPHDNAIIAAGLAKYGFCEEAHQVMSAIFDATLHFESQRLPELFCGFERLRNQSITSFPVACSPQAWSAGCTYLFIEACLGIKIKPEEKTIYFYKPSLPEFLNELIISEFPVNNERVTIEVKNHNGDIKIKLLVGNNTQIKIISESEFSQQV